MHRYHRFECKWEIIINPFPELMTAESIKVMAHAWVLVVCYLIGWCNDWSFRSKYWGPFALKPPSEITSDPGIWSNYAWGASGIWVDINVQMELSSLNLVFKCLEERQHRCLLLKALKKRLFDSVSLIKEMTQSSGSWKSLCHCVC